MRDAGFKPRTTVSAATNEPQHLLSHYLEGGQVCGPLGAHPLGVVHLLLPLYDVPDAGLGLGVGHHHVGPRLGVGAAGRSAGRSHNVVHHLAGHRPLTEEPQRAPLVHLLHKMLKLKVARPRFNRLFSDMFSVVFLGSAFLK